jgi:hypothetical protein
MELKVNQDPEEFVRLHLHTLDSQCFEFLATEDRKSELLRSMNFLERVSETSQIRVFEILIKRGKDYAFLISRLLRWGVVCPHESEKHCIGHVQQMGR